MQCQAKNQSKENTYYRHATYHVVLDEKCHVAQKNFPQMVLVRTFGRTHEAHLHQSIKIIDET